MILLWFTAGVVPAVLLGVYLPWSAWVLPVGLGSLAAGFLFKGLKKWPPLRRFLFGAGAILVWLAVYSALFHAPAQDLEHRTIQMEAVVTQWPEETDYGVRVPVRAGRGKAGRCPRCFMDRRTWRTCARGTGYPAWPAVPRRRSWGERRACTTPPRAFCFG